MKKYVLLCGLISFMYINASSLYTQDDMNRMRDAYEKALNSQRETIKYLEAETSYLRSELRERDEQDQLRKKEEARILDLIIALFSRK